MAEPKNVGEIMLTSIVKAYRAAENVTTSKERSEVFTELVKACAMALQTKGISAATQQTVEVISDLAVKESKTVAADITPAQEEAVSSPKEDIKPVSEPVAEEKVVVPPAKEESKPKEEPKPAVKKKEPVKAADIKEEGPVVITPKPPVKEEKKPEPQKVEPPPKKEEKQEVQEEPKEEKPVEPPKAQVPLENLVTEEYELTEVWTPKAMEILKAEVSAFQSYIARFGMDSEIMCTLIRDATSGRARIVKEVTPLNVQMVVAYIKQLEQKQKKG